MKYKIDHDYHIHSHLSLCSGDPEQNTQRILKYAEDNGLSTICLTDHFWDERIEGASEWYQFQNREHIKQALPLPQSEKVKFLFGAETDMNMIGTIGANMQTCDELDFIIVPTTHLHMKGFTISEENFLSIERRIDMWYSRFENVLNSNLPFHKTGIAHLACSGLAHTHEAYIEILDRLEECRMEKLFSKAAALGVGIEINHHDMSFPDSEADTVLRMFRIAKYCGCKFYCGSDAHHPTQLDEMKDVIERAINLLELEETDKFHIDIN